MREFVLLFKVLMKNQNSRTMSKSGRRKLPAKLTMVLAMLPVGLLLCIVFGFLASIIPDIKTLSMVCNAIITVVQIFALFISLFDVMNTLYNSPDTPFLNTLPIKQTAVFFAKFTLAYLNMLAFMASLILPALLTTSIVYAALGNPMFYGFFPLTLLITLIAPILPLFILTLFSMPISYIGTFFKGKAVLRTVLSILFYMAIMVGYMLLMYFLGMKEDTGEAEDGIVMSQGLLSGLATFSKVMYPNKVLLDFCLGISAGKNFGISFAITVGMIAIMLLMAMMFYRRINEKRLETHAEKSKSSMSFKQSGLVAALMKKDFKDIMRTPQLAMASIANILVCPIITAIMFFASDIQMSGGESEAELVYVAQMLKLSYLVLYSTIFLAGTNMLAGLAFTREGKSFYVSKSLPIRARDRMNAKFILSLIPPAAIAIVQMIIALALYRLDIVNTLLFMVCICLMIVGSSALHIYCDMRYGNVNWNNRQDLQQVSRGNKGQILLIFGVLAISLIAMISGMVLASFAELIGGMIVVYAVFWSIVFVLSAALCVTGILVLKFKAEPYYDQIGERQFKAKYASRRNLGGPRGNKMLMK